MVFAEKQGAILTFKKVVKSRGIDMVLCKYNLADNTTSEVVEDYAEQVKGQQKDALVTVFNLGYGSTLQSILNYTQNHGISLKDWKPTKTFLENLLTVCRKLGDTPKIYNAYLERYWDELNDIWNIDYSIRRFRSESMYNNGKIAELFKVCYEYYCADRVANDNYISNFDDFRNNIISNFPSDWDAQDLETYCRILYIQGAHNFVSGGTVEAFMKKCKFLNIKVPSGNFITNYRQVSIQYQEQADRRYLQIFQEMQGKIILENVETEQYTVAIPMNRQELGKYGTQLQNCLNGHEWINFLRTGKRQVIVIIDKAQNKACAAIDFNLESDRIYQFLSYHNSLPSDEIVQYFETFIRPQLKKLLSK